MTIHGSAALARAALSFVLVAASVVCAQPEGSVQRSPYTAATFHSERLRVQIDDAWYQLAGIGVEGGRRLSWDELRAAAEKAFERRWQERVAMDLDAVIEAAGARAGDTVTVWGGPVAGPEAEEVAAEVELKDVPHTTKRRGAARDYYRGLEDRARAARTYAPARPLLQVAEALRSSHAQGMRLGVDWDAAAAAEIRQLGESAPQSAIVRAAQRLVAMSGDGHARVDEFAGTVPAGRLPFALVWVGGEWRGQMPGGGSWIWPAGARDVRIDGVPLDAWLGAVRPYVAAGAVHLVRQRAASLAGRVMFVRELLGVRKTASDPVEATWLPPKGTEPGLFRAGVAEKPALAAVPNAIKVDEQGIGFAWRQTEGGHRVGCIRIADMGSGSPFANSLRAAIAQAATGDAMLIDVRGNGGGDREALLILLPYLMKQDALVFNLARPRLAMFPRRGIADELLTDRYLRPSVWSGWSAPERVAVDAAIRSVHPSWAPDEGWEAAGFGPWYAGVVSRERHGKEIVAPFAGPVVVLLDGECFSATDIFLGAIEQLPNVTLVGAPSGGGSARKTDVTVAGPPAMELVLASIASFRPDGRAYDGAGIEPDVLAEPTPEDYEGRTDSVMDAGLRAAAAGIKPH